MEVTQAKIDDTDWRILAELQLDGRLSYKELGRRIHISAPAVAERVRRLEDAGVIVGYGAQVDPSHAGLPLLAFPVALPSRRLPPPHVDCGRLPGDHRRPQAGRGVLQHADGARVDDFSLRGTSRTPWLAR
jgi:DNA-binding Lrp family transcriptional regulator